MSRRFWGAVMLVSLLTIIGGGTFLYKTLLDRSTVTMPLQPVAAKEEPAIKEEPISAEEPKQEPEKPAKRNIQFLYINSKAKNVSLVGNFEGKSKVVKKAMQKNANKWTIVLQLEPGTYEYVYLVNGKNVRDPYAKKTVNGKSQIVVSPPPTN